MFNKIPPVMLLLMASLLAACEQAATPDQMADQGPANLDDVAKWGRTLAAEKCNSCHQPKGAAGQQVPFLEGQNKFYLRSAMDAYLNGQRDHEQMASALANVPDQERDALAAWFSSNKGAWAGRDTLTVKVLAEYRDQSLVDKGKAVANPCFSCHGPDGNSIKEGVPSLAGLQPAYFRAALKAYVSGERQGAQVMKNFKLALNDVTIRQLAAYFTHQSRRRSELPAGAGNARAGAGLAGRHCAGCHGPDGNSYNPEFPGLAGQNAAYLEKASLHYRQGNRSHPLMKTAIAGVSDSDIRDIAAWYASREPAAVLKTRSAGEQTFNPLAQGEILARACNGCHGQNGISTTPGIPSLAGLSDRYLSAAIQAYRDGGREHTVMTLQVKSLLPEEAEKIALYYASLSPEPPPPDAAELMRREQQGQQHSIAPANPPLYIADCNGCHGTNGNSSDAAIPRLAGQDALYLEQAIHAYKKGKRRHEDMNKAASKFNKEQIKGSAAYYTLVTPKAQPFRAPERLEQIAARCNRCHGEGGLVSDAKTPRIAGQSYDYLRKTLEDYQSRRRKDPIMQKMTAQLGSLELDAIARYYAGK